MNDNAKNTFDELGDFLKPKPFQFHEGALFNGLYRIGILIGKGGMGKVYKAYNLQNNREVCIKRIIYTKDQEQRERFKQEYNFLRQINHPNIVSVLDFFELHSEFFCVMEYIDGMNLRDYIREKAWSISFLDQLAIASKLARIVQALNTAGILHRDIKPANIIINPQLKIVKMLDLGLAKSLNEDFHLTKTGDIIGTSEYMSPEQINSEYSLKTDVFSLGITLYQFFLWLSQSPFKAETMIATFTNLSEKQLPLFHKSIQFSQKQAEVYYRVSQILEQALHKKPSLRIGAEKLADELEMIYDLLRRIQGKSESEWQRTKGIDPYFLKHLEALKTEHRKFFPSVSKEKKSQKRRKIEKSNTRRMNILIGTGLIFLFATLSFFYFKRSNTKQILQTAHNFYESKKYKKGLLYIENALKTQKNIRTRLKIRYLQLKIRIANNQDIEVLKKYIYDELQDFPIGYKFVKLFIDQKDYINAQKYIRKILSFSKGKKKNTSKADKLLAHILLKRHKYDKAYKMYKQLNQNESDVLLGMVEIKMHKGAVHHAHTLLHKIKAQDPKTLSLFHFWKAKTLWHIYQKELNKASWLCPYIEKTDETKRIKKKIEQIKFHWEKAQYYSENKKRVTPYLHGMDIELIPSQSQDGRKFEKYTKNIPADRTYQKIKVRYFIKQQMWEKSLQECNRLAKRIPLDTDVYFFRAITLFKLHKLEQALEDIYYMNRLNFTVTQLKTFEVFFLENVTIKELRFFAKVFNQCIYGKRAIDTYLFEEDIKKLKILYMRERKKRLAKAIKDKLKLFIAKKQYRLLKDILKHYYIKDSTLNYIKSFSNNHNKEDIADIITLIKKEQEKDTLFKIKKNLLQFYILHNEKYLLKIGAIKSFHRYLEQILKDTSSPLLQIVAGKSLLKFSGEKGYSQLISYASGEKFPLNLIAAIVLKDQSLSHNFSAIKNITQYPLIYQILYAKYVTFNSENHDNIIDLLNSDNEKILLYMFHNLRKYKIYKSLLDRATKKLLLSKHDHIRAMFIRSQWDITKYGVTIRNLRRKMKHQSKVLLELKKYLPVLAKLFTQPFPLTKLAIMRISHYKKFKNFIQKQRFHGRFLDAKLKIKQEIQKIRKSKVPILRFWALSTLIVWDNSSQTPIDRLIKEKTTFFEKVSCMSIGIMHQKTNVKEIQKILQFQNSIPRTRANIKLKQFLSISFGKYTKIFSPEMMLQKWLKGSKHKQVKVATIAGLLFCGTRSSVKLVTPFLKDKDSFTKKVAIATLASITLKYAKRMLSSFHEKVEKMGPEYCQYAALGYYLGTMRTIPEPILLNPQRHYERYLLYLGKRVKRSWIFALTKAVQIYPHHKYYFELGYCYKQFRNYQKSLRGVKQAIRLIKKEKEKNFFWRRRLAIYYATLAEVYFLLKQEQKGSQYINIANQLNPLYEKNSIIIAEHLRKKEQFSKAAHYYHKAFFTNTFKKVPLLYAAKMYIKDNKKEKALSTLQLLHNSYPLKYFHISEDKDLHILKYHPWVRRLERE